MINNFQQSRSAYQARLLLGEGIMVSEGCWMNRGFVGFVVSSLLSKNTMIDPSLFHFLYYNIPILK